MLVLFQKYSSQHSCGIRITYFKEKDVGEWTCITYMQGHKKKFRKSLWLGLAWTETSIALTTTTTFTKGRVQNKKTENIMNLVLFPFGPSLHP